MNPAHCLLITVDNMFPGPLRLVAIDPATSVGDLCLIINAALGLEPSPPGHFVGEEGAEFDAIDVLDSGALEMIFARSDFATYHPTAGTWEIMLTSLSPTEIVQTTPALIDATGPDLFSPAGDTGIMSGMLENVRQLLSGVPIPESQLHALSSSFPNYSLEQIRTRLTECHQPLIVARLGELISTDLNASIDADLPDPFDLPMNPAQALHTLLEETYPGLASGVPIPGLSAPDREQLGQIIADCLQAIRNQPKLTVAGHFKPKLVQELVQILQPGQSPAPTPKRESQAPLVRLLHDVFENAELIYALRGTVYLSPEAHQIITNPARGAAAILDFLPLIYEDSDVLVIAIIYSALLQNEPIPAQMQATFETEAWQDNRQLLLALGALDPTGEFLTPLGRGLVGELMAELHEVITRFR